jgi:pyruvate formate lyase activating enzyme
MELHEAKYWQSLDNGRIECLLCPQDCKIADGQSGLCRGRVHKGTKLIAESYGRVTSVALDPVEKKPLYHFFPGKRILSAGTYGCNLRCQFCQNCEISQQSPPNVSYEEISPEDLVAMARSQRSIGIAYTYNEPFIWYEYVYDTSVLARQNGLANVLVTNGYVNPKPLAGILPLVDAMNIDIKAFTDDFYRKIAGGSLAPILETVKASVKAGVHVETTTLIIPGYNDSPEELQALADWMAGELGPDVPAHLSAYFPRYKFKAPPTSVDDLRKAYDILKKKLSYVYMGNVVCDEGCHTCCKKCGAVQVERFGYSIKRVNIKKDGSCGKCGSQNCFVETVKPPPTMSDK